MLTSASETMHACVEMTKFFFPYLVDISITWAFHVCPPPLSDLSRHGIDGPASPHPSQVAKTKKNDCICWITATHYVVKTRVMGHQYWSWPSLYIHWKSNPLYLYDTPLWPLHVAVLSKSLLEILFRLCCWLPDGCGIGWWRGYVFGRPLWVDGSGVRHVLRKKVPIRQEDNILADTWLRTSVTSFLRR
jgi:hypothetical protein